MTITSHFMFMGLHRRAGHGWQASSAALSDFLQRKRRTGLRNTGSLHMYCVVAATERDATFGTATCLAVVSLLVVGVQVTILTVIAFESSHVSCNTHTDCHVGEFCFAWRPSFQNARCSDCIDASDAAMMAAGIDPTSACASYVDWVDGDEIDHTYARLSNPARWPDGKFNVTIEDQCLAWIHCKQTDVMPLECDYLQLNLERLNATIEMVLVVVSFLLAVPLAADMDDAAAEETLLDHRLRTRDLSRPVRVASELLRVSLRIRRFILAAVASAATVAINLYSDITAQELLLNLLAVSIITEADDLWAMLVLRVELHAQMEAAATLDDVAADAVLPWLGPRVQAVLCVAFIVFACDAARAPEPPSHSPQAAVHAEAHASCSADKEVDWLIRTFGYDHFGAEYRLPLSETSGVHAPAVCSDMLEALIVPVFLMCLFFVLLLHPLAATCGDAPRRSCPQALRWFSWQIWLSVPALSTTIFLIAIVVANFNSMAVLYTAAASYIAAVAAVATFGLQAIIGTSSVPARVSRRVEAPTPRPDVEQARRSHLEVDGGGCARDISPAPAPSPGSESEYGGSETMSSWVEWW